MMHQQTTNIPNTSNASLPYTSPSVVSGYREDYRNLVVPLYEATMIGDWGTAKFMFDMRPDLVRCGLSNLGTALHVAATAKETKEILHFVKNLVNMMTIEDLELKNKHGNTAFWIACASDKRDMAEIMMGKNRSLMNIRGDDEYLPLSIGAKMGSYKIVKWLYRNSNKMSDTDHWKDMDEDLILLGCVENELFDIALEILMDRPELARNVVVLEVLVQMGPWALKKFTFMRVLYHKIVRSSVLKVRRRWAENQSNSLEILKIIWGDVMRTMNVNEIEDMLRGPPTTLADGTIQHYSRILFVAAEKGNTMIIVEVLRTYPDLALNRNDDGLTIFHIAVMQRHTDIYNLLYEIGDSSKEIWMLSDKSGNNMLHLIGKTSKGMAYKMSGASLLMQQEIIWFMEISRKMPSYLKEAKNKDGQTPSDLFLKENEHLISKGLKLMKDCMLVATLIITVSFAVAFTIPGGYNQEHGLPIFTHKLAFLVFVIADAISLIASSTALIVFLSILTFSDNQRALMYILPRSLMICLLLLIISIAAMMMTFSASLFVLYHKRLTWLPLLIAILTTTPVILFAVVHYPYFMDMVRSLYDTRYLFQPKKSMLYTTKPSLHM